MTKQDDLFFFSDVNLRKIPGNTPLIGTICEQNDDGKYGTFNSGIKRYFWAREVLQAREVMVLKDLMA